MLHPDVIQEYVLTNNENDALEKLALIVEYLMKKFDDEQIRFAKQNDIPFDIEEYSKIKEDYRAYLISLLVGMRERVREELSQKTDLDQFDRQAYVMTNFETIESTEWSNTKQLAQFVIVLYVARIRPNAKITKKWVARVGACDKCQAMNGVEIPLNESFLRNGQEITLANGETFIYDYIDREVAVLHPHDRCYVEFKINY